MPKGAASTPPLLESSMNNQITTNIQMTPQGVELVLTALNQLPRGQVEALFQDIVNQYQAEIKRMQAEAHAAEDATVTDAED
jgi:hypothetical protein